MSDDAARVDRLERDAMESSAAIYVVQLADLARSVIAERDAAYKRHENWKHGTCCTCQRCGKWFDDCRCELDEVIAERDRMQMTFRQEPCSKCGHGIQAGCYGCQLEAARAERDKAVADLRGAREALTHHTDKAHYGYHPDACPQCNLTRAALSERQEGRDGD
jgi:hypothetical protein